MTNKYYTKHASSYIAEVESYDLSNVYPLFLKYLKANASLLDLGAGSGRDSRYFSNLGYTVTSLDANETFIKYMQAHQTNRVIHSTMEEYTTDEMFDGIWACASLLHIKKKNIKTIIEKYVALLKPSGVFYMCFKEGEHERMSGIRFYNDYTMETLGSLLKSIDHTKVLHLFKTIEEKENENQVWINAIIIKL